MEKKFIDYPISYKYREHWGNWECIRELVQNALDAHSKKYTHDKVDGNLVITDDGPGLELNHLLFGESHKTNENPRGKFGEGLKIALLVFKRMGYDIKIFSRKIVVEVADTTIADTTCLRLYYHEPTSSEYFDGTKVVVYNYKGPLFQERFINPSTKILYKDCYNNYIIKREPGKPGVLYVRDIYVQELEESQFSYNLNSCDLEESRNIASAFSIHYNMGSLWICCPKPALLQEFLRAVENKKYEYNAIIRYLPTYTIKRLRRIFKKMYPKSVIQTSYASGKEAVWRGYRVIDWFNSEHHSGLIKCLPTDQELLAKCAKDKIIRVRASSLKKQQKDVLNILKRLTNDYKIDVAPVIFKNSEIEGMAGNPILINVENLNDLTSSLSILIHELAHTIYKSEDMTREFIHDISKAGAELLKPYVEKEFETTIIEKGDELTVKIPEKLANEICLYDGCEVSISINRN